MSAAWLTALPELRTDFVRTSETAAPLARALKKEPVVLPKGDPRLLVERLRTDHSGQTVLLVGHTDTLPGLAKALGYPAEIKIEPQDFSNLFVVAAMGSGAPVLLRLRYREASVLAWLRHEATNLAMQEDILEDWD